MAAGMDNLYLAKGGLYRMYGYRKQFTARSPRRNPHPADQVYVSWGLPGFFLSSKISPAAGGLS
jgi:hypothetical protein